MTKATISAKGQVSIPRAIQERLNLKPGTHVTIVVQGEQLIVRRLTAKSTDWHTMQGLARNGPSLTKALEEEHAGELARSEARIKGH